MDMVRLLRIIIDCFKINQGIMFPYLHEFCFKIRKNSLIQPFVSVFSCYSHMVIAVIYTMCQFNKFHASIVLSNERILEETTSPAPHARGPVGEGMRQQNN